MLFATFMNIVNKICELKYIKFEKYAVSCFLDLSYRPNTTHTKCFALSLKLKMKHNILILLKMLFYSAKKQTHTCTFYLLFRLCVCFYKCMYITPLCVYRCEYIT